MQGRSDVEIEIYGMEGIPEKDQEEHAKKMRDGGPKSKRAKNDESSDESSDDNDSTNRFMGAGMGFPGMGMPVMGMPGMMPGGPMGMNMMGMPMGNMGMPMGPMGMNNPMRWPMPNQGMMGPGPMGPMPPGPIPPGPMRPGAMGPGPVGGPNVMGPVRPPISESNTAPGGGMSQQANHPTSTNNNDSDAHRSEERNTASNVPKPLFPAASNIQQKNRNNQAEGDGSAGLSGPKSLSSTSKLMHPDDEELSLEEIRSRTPKYQNPQKKVAPPLGSPPLHGSNYHSRGPSY